MQSFGIKIELRITVGAYSNYQNNHYLFRTVYAARYEP